MKKSALLCYLLLIVFTAKANHLLTKLYPRHLLEESVVQPMHFAPVPNASSNYWKLTVGRWMRNSYVNNGKVYLGKPWTPIPDSVFREYSDNGNRSNYEKWSFGLRKQLACMVMAEVMQDSGVFIDDIIHGLHYFKQETWWGVPAHYPKPLPDPNLQEVDLFNAETANLLAWTCYMLEDRIKTKDRRICRDIQEEIKRRILIPARTIDYFWKRHSWNHNTWTCANWLSCILFCEENRQQQIDDICQVLKCLDIFLDGYPEDGGCDEGVMYWDRAAGSLFECMQLLELASNGKISLPQTKKIKSMASYIYNMYIGNDQYVNFSASNTKALPNINILYPFGRMLNDTIMTQYAAYIGQRYEYIGHPWKLFNQSGNFPSISRELCFLRLMPHYIKERPKEPQTISSWLPQTEIFTAHSPNGLYIAAKGGNNDESQNHNDIGNFIVYVNGEPLFIDLGNDTYNAKPFSNERYTLMNTRSAFHNVPIINGQEQQAGRDFYSKNAKMIEENGYRHFTLDIANAYPPTSAVKSWVRSISLLENSISISENYKLNDTRQQSQITLMTIHKPQIIVSGLLFDLPNSKCFLTFSNRELKPEIEVINISGTGMESSWGKQVYRIKLNILSRKKRNKIIYSIHRQD